MSKCPWAKAPYGQTSTKLSDLFVILCVLSIVVDQRPVAGSKMPTLQILTHKKKTKHFPSALGSSSNDQLANLSISAKHRFTLLGFYRCLYAQLKAQVNEKVHVVYSSVSLRLEWKL